THLDSIVAELDRRRHALMSMGSRVTRPAVLASAGGALAALTTGAVVLGVQLRHRRQRLPARVRRLREALGRMVDRPDQVARAKPTIWKKVLSTVLTAIAGVAAKR